MSVCAVVVTYRPDLEVLRRVIDAVGPQVSETVIVDNSVPAIPAKDLSATVLPQDRNIGLAAAQNVGIGWAREHGHSHVLILDQDSIPGDQMVEKLLAGLNDLAATTKVGAVGPRFTDPRSSEQPFVRVAFPMSKKIFCAGDDDSVQVDFLISSGVLIPLAVLDDVGEMDEGIFIDNVDMEWSFRARSLGYGLYGICGATMAHHLGDELRPVLGGRATVVRHGPVRLYYIMRNRLALYRRRHTPRVWIAQDVPRVLFKFLIFAVLVGPRIRNMRYMLRGLSDGARGRTGPCPLSST